MRRTAVAVCLLMTLVALDATAQTQTLNYANFDELSVGSGMRLSITQGNTFRVTASGSSDDLSRLEVEQNGRSLEFRIESRFFSGRIGPISLAITMPTLRRIGLSGGAQGRLTVDVGTQALGVDLSGGSRLDGEVRSGDIALSLSGGSRATLSGSAQNLELDGSGGSNYSLKGLSATNLDASFSGGSTATVTLNGRIDADLSGGSDITYYGNATVGSQQASGGSRVRRGN